MNRKNNANLLPLAITLTAVAVIFVIMAGGIAYLLLDQGDDPAPVVAEATEVIEEPLIFIDPTATNHPRPQSGGGGPSGEGPYDSEQLTSMGTLESYDRATGLLAMALDEGDTPLVRVMPFTRIITEDMTWDGAVASVDDLQPGMYLQVDLLASEPQPPYAQTVWIRRENTNPFWNEDHTPQSGEIGSWDPNTGLFTLMPITVESFYVDDETRIIVDDDSFDGTPVDVGALQVGQMVDIFAEVGDQMLRRVALIIIQPNTPSKYLTSFKGTVGTVDGNQLVVLTAQPPDEGPSFTIEIGPAGYAESQGVSFAVDDLVMFSWYMDDTGQFVVYEVINITTGQWLRLRDDNGPLWQN